MSLSIPPVLSTDEKFFSVILGGGYGGFTAQHGLAIDNLVEVRVENYCPS